MTANATRVQHGVDSLVPSGARVGGAGLVPASAEDLDELSEPDPGAFVVASGDADFAVVAHREPLVVGSNTVEVAVTAEDGTVAAYVVEVVRAGPLVLSTASVDGAGVVLVYDEVLDAASVPDVGTFAVAVTDSVTGAESERDVTEVSVDGRVVSLSLSASVRLGDVVTLSYTPGVSPISDTAGERAAALDAHAAANDTAAAAVASLDSLGLGGIVLAPGFAPAETEYSASVLYQVSQVSVAASPADWRATVSVWPVDADDVAAGHQVALGVGETQVQVTVTAEDGTTTTTYSVEVTRAEAPQLVSASVYGDSLVLAYGEALDAGSEPDPGAFAVAVTDFVTEGVSARAVTDVAVEGSSVMLTLSGPVRFGDAVAVSYTPGASAVRAAAGANHAAALDAHAAANTTAAVSDAGLEELLVSGIVLAPGFAPAETEYSASVLYQVSQVSVAASPADWRATVSVWPVDVDDVAAGHQVALGVGETQVQVTVTAEDGTTTTTYSVEVTRADDTDSPVLASASVNGAELVLAYDEDLDAASEPDPGAFAVAVTDSVTGAESQPTVTGVSVNGREVTLTLSAPARFADAVAVSYTPGVSPISDTAGNDAAPLAGHTATNDTAASADTSLETLQLTLSSMGLAPGFNPAVRQYSASVPYEVSSTTVRAAAADSRASVAVASGDADFAVVAHREPLVVGSNTVEVAVTAEDGTVAAYVVEVVRAGPLVLSTASVDGAGVVLVYDEVLDAASVPDVGTFAVAVTDSVTGAESERDVTEVSVDGRVVSLSLSASVRLGDVVTLSYTPGVSPISDTAGERAAALDAHAAANDTAAAAVASLDSLGLGGIVLAPGFAPAETEYSASVLYQVSQVSVAASPADWRATVSVWPVDADDVAAGHQVALGVGETQVQVTVTAEDGTTTTTYSVEVTRADDTDSPVLASASVNGAELVLAYDEDLDAASEPDPGAFAVAVTDFVTEGVSARAVTDVAVEGSSVMLTLSGPVRFGDAVAVSYTPGASAVRAAAGANHAAALDAHAAANTTAAVSDAGLEELLVSGIVLAPGFAPAETEYSASVLYQVSQVSVAASPADWRATVSVWPVDADDVAAGHQVALGVGETQVQVTVTAEDGTTTTTYSVEVTRAEAPQLVSASVYGDSLVLAYGEALDAGSEPDPGAFAVAVTDFVTEGVSARAVTDVAVEGSSVMLTLSGPVRFGDAVAVSYTPGASAVRAAAGANHAAALDAHAAANTTAAVSDAGLEELLVSGIVLAPGFAPAETEYSASVLYQVSQVSVAASPADWRATVSVWPVDVDDVAAGHQVALGVGETQVQVTVTAEDGTTTTTYSVEVTRADDTDSPVLASASVNGAELVLAYDEDLDAASEPDPGAFAVAVTDSVTGAESQPTVTGVSVNGREVTLTLSAPARFADAVAVSYTPGVSPISDTAGNDAAPLAGHTATNDTAASADTSLETLQLTLSSMGLAPGFNPAVREHSAQAPYEATVNLEPQFDPAVREYSASVLYEAIAVTVTATSAGSRSSITVEVTGAAETVPPGLAPPGLAPPGLAPPGLVPPGLVPPGLVPPGLVPPGLVPPDTTPPLLVSASVDGAALVLVYNEDLDAVSQPAAAAFAVKVTDSADDAAVAVAVAVDAVDVAGAEVTLTLTPPVRHDDTVTVAYTPGAAPLQDTAGNDATAFNAGPVTNDTAAATDTKLASLTLTAAGSALTLTPVFAAGTGSYTAFVPHATALVKVTAAAADSRAEASVTPLDADNNDVNGHQVPLEVGANTVEVTVTAENDATGVYTVTVTRGPDTTPPLLVSATVDGAALVLVYDENLDAVSQPAAAAFAVMVTDSAVDAAVAVAVAVDVAGAEVTLTLTPPVRHDDTVTVAYTPGAAPLQDVAGNDAAAFNAGPVDNDTAAAADTKLVSLALTADSSSVSLTPVFAAGTVTYTAFVPNETALVTVTAAAVDSRAEASVTPLDDDNNDVNGHQVPLEVGATTVEVTVTAENDATGVYTVTVTRGPAPGLVSASVDGAALVLVYNEDLDAVSQPAAAAFAVKVTGPVTNDTAAATDTKLASLTLTAAGSALTLTPVFAANTGSYTAFVPHATALVKVTAAAADSRAEASVTPLDADNNDVNGHQVPLEVGANTVEVTVTAENDATGVYTVTRRTTPRWRWRWRWTRWTSPGGRAAVR